MVNEDLSLKISRMTTAPGRINPVRAPRGTASARFSSRRSRISRGIALAVGAAMTLLVIAVSNGSAQAPPPNNKNVADSKLAVKINTALWSDLRFPGRQISVETQDGVVTLRGKVDSEETKKAADDIGQGVRDYAGTQVLAPSWQDPIERTEHANHDNLLCTLVAVARSKNKRLQSYCQRNASRECLKLSLEIAAKDYLLTDTGGRRESHPERALQPCLRK